MSNLVPRARSGGRSRRLTAALGAVALACWQAHAAAWQVLPPPAGQAAPSPTVVVLPFANLSGQPEDDWLGAGIAETVATDLRAAGATVVVPGAGRSGASGDESGNGGRATGATADRTPMPGAGDGSVSTAIARWVRTGSWRAATSEAETGCD